MYNSINYLHLHQTHPMTSLTRSSADSPAFPPPCPPANSACSVTLPHQQTPPLRDSPFPHSSPAPALLGYCSPTQSAPLPPPPHSPPRHVCRSPTLKQVSGTSASNSGSSRPCRAPSKPAPPRRTPPPPSPATGTSPAKCASSYVARESRIPICRSASESPDTSGASQTIRVDPKTHLEIVRVLVTWHRQQELELVCHLDFGARQKDCNCWPCIYGYI